MCIEGYKESRALLVVSKDRLVEVTKATSDLLLEVRKAPMLRIDLCTW